MNSGNAPSGSDRRDPARSRASEGPAAVSGEVTIPPAGSGRPDASAARHRIAAGLPPQPPLGPAKGATRPDLSAATAAGTGPARGLAGLSPTAAELLRASSIPAAAGAAATAGKSEPSKRSPPGPTMLDRPRPTKLADVKTGLAAPAPGTPPPASPGRQAPDDPEPRTSGRPEATAVSTLELRRITPRSPRAALEPDHVPLPSRAAPPSRRVRNPLVIVGNAVFTILILAVLAAGAAAVIGKSRFEAPGPLLEDKVVIIPPGPGVIDIAELLRREGVIDEHRLIFIGGVFALKARSDLKAGEYIFPKRASVKDILETIVEGKVVQHQVTIPEGLTSEQIVARLLESDILSGNIKDVPREGTLLPDSYHVHRGFTREQMIQRMRQSQDRLVREVWERRSPDLPLKTPEQLVILASIVEKETGKPEERTRIAAVFTNRLKQKMRLQTDPTVIYGLVQGKGSLGHPLTRSELTQPTPYNTYIIDGLPPGPIANPGRASIEAAASPARTKELYFAADGTGGHAFAETYEQHLKNVARLRAIEQGDRGEASPDAQTPARVGPTAPAARGKRGASGSSKSAGAGQ